MSLFQLQKLYSHDNFSSYSSLLFPNEQHLITYNEITIAINNHKVVNKNNNSKLYGQLYVTNLRLLFLFENINDGFYVELKNIKSCIAVEQNDKLWKSSSVKKKIELALINPLESSLNENYRLNYFHSWDCPVCFDSNKICVQEQEHITSYICKLCGTNIIDTNELVNYKVSSNPVSSTSSELLSSVTCEKCTFTNDLNCLNCSMCLNPLLLNKVKLHTLGTFEVTYTNNMTEDKIKIYYTNGNGNDIDMCYELNSVLTNEKLERNMHKMNLSGENVTKKLINNIRQERINETSNRQKGIRTLMSEKESKITELDILLDTSLTNIETFMSLSEEVESFFKEIGEYKNEKSDIQKMLVKRTGYDINICIDDKWFMKDLFKEFIEYLNECDYAIMSLNDLYTEYNMGKRTSIGFISTEEFGLIVKEYKKNNKFNKYTITSVDKVSYLINKTIINNFVNVLLELLVKNIGNEEVDINYLEKNVNNFQGKVATGNLLPIIKLSLDKCIEKGNVLIDDDVIGNRCYYHYNHLL
ncbi:hypothetical protein QEN19_002145 [Hanseniaspora menglaensis]